MDPEAALAFLRWLMQPEQAGAWYASAETYYAPYLHACDDAPMWSSDRRRVPYRDSIATSIGWLECHDRRHRQPCVVMAGLDPAITRPRVGCPPG